MKFRRFHIILTFVLLSLNVDAQHRKEDLVQFSGIIVTADSLRPVPFTNISVNNSSRGTSADYWGFFSIVVAKNDVITFSAMGYKKVVFVIPDTLTSNRYSLIQVMTSDTIMLSETVIYPWPTKEHFRRAFLKLQIPDDDIEIARKNLEYMAMRDRDPRNYDPERFGMDAGMNYRNYVNNSTDKLYYAGQQMPNNLLNPIAWAKFIQAWKRGDFKRKY